MPRKRTKPRKKSQKIKPWKKPKLKDVDDQRDGMTTGFITIKEKLIEILSQDGTGGQYNWFSHAGLIRRLKEQEGLNLASDRKSIYFELASLVKYGFVERGKHPTREGKAYVYRRTQKAFKLKRIGNNFKAKGENVEKGYFIFCNNRKFPKWFRDMLH